jgi:MFS family permease
MNNEKKIIFFTCIAHYFTHFYELIFPALAIPLVISLKMDLADVLKLSFVMYLLYGLAALPWGMFADRYGNRKSLIIFFIGTGAGAILTSLSGTQMSITISLAFIGFFASIYHPAGMGLISIGIKNRGTALGINGFAGNLGLMSAPFIAGLLNWLVGWEITYFLIGIISIAWGLTMIFVDIDETPVHFDDNDHNQTNSNNIMTYFLILCIVMTLAGLVYRANSIVLPAYFEYRAGFLWDFFRGLNLSNLEGAKTMAATMLASTVYIVSAIGQLAGGRIADKYDLRWAYLIFHLLSLPFVILVGLFSEQFLVISAALYVFFALGMQPIENSLVAKFTPNRWRSTGFGIKFILVFGVGSLAVYIVGWIKEAWSLSAVYYSSGIVIALMIVFIILLIGISRNVSCKNLE